MLRNEIFDWLRKTFGESRHGDNITFTEIISIKNDKKEGKTYRIIEIKLAVQTKYYDPIEFNPVVMKEWKRQLNEISENSVRSFHCDLSKIFQAEAPDSEKLREARSFLLTLAIFQKQEI